MADPRPYLHVEPAGGCPWDGCSGDGTVNDHGDTTTCTDCHRPV